MKELIVIRGLPGSGKTTLAKRLGPYQYFEADDFFIKDGVYTYDREKIKEAHAECQNRVLRAMSCFIPLVIVSNTFVKRWEIQPYLDMAETHGYRVTELTMSGPLHPNVHGVPDEVITRMRENWEK